MNQASPLPLPGSHFIPLSQAIEMTSLYRSQRENILATPYQNQNILPICETFNRADVDTIMAKQNCEAIRIYFGMDETFKVKVIIVPVDENAEDILPLLRSKPIPKPPRTLSKKAIVALRLVLHHHRLIHDFCFIFR